MGNDLLCSNCGGRTDRPGLFGCSRPGHVEPDLAQRIVAAIEADLSDRRGLSGEWDAIDDKIQGEIRDRWAEIVRKELEAIP